MPCPPVPLLLQVVCMRAPGKAAQRLPTGKNWSEVKATQSLHRLLPSSRGATRSLRRIGKAMQPPMPGRNRRTGGATRTVRQPAERNDRPAEHLMLFNLSLGAGVTRGLRRLGLLSNRQRARLVKFPPTCLLLLGLRS
eukprot:TRINITY_DN13490_c0_g2_i1.p3 TRINITY_DN13490_c0_g2~~TRINITY_DN13490_c0_g2_i1.p3  ORF type:complete len:138 (+),score=2.33 TRINITY_DN13490_c0_g2_i1:273-686(+)